MCLASRSTSVKDDDLAEKMYAATVSHYAKILKDSWGRVLAC